MIRKITVKENQKRVLPVIWTGKDSSLDYEINLRGRGAEITFLMLLFGKENQSVVIKANVYHAMPETKSRVIVKGVLQGRSKVDFEGLVKIEPNARGAKTWLAAHLLLLSSEATGRAVPNLEIANNEVVAGHAATVGRVNEMELFYLMSRGLTKDAATNLLVQGFLRSLLIEFPESDAKKAKKQLKWI